MYKPEPKKLQNSGTKRHPKKLPEFLEADEVKALIQAAPNTRAKLAMLIQWRAGLRISEAIAVTRSDCHIDAEPPELKVRQGKGSKDRLVPLHPDLRDSLENFLDMSDRKAADALVGVTRQVAWRWYKEALAICYAAGTDPRR